MPIFYMFWRFANFSKNLSEFLQSWDVLTLFLNTIFLFIAVILTSLFLGLLISILIVRYEIPASKLLFTLTILPLVIPSYIGALTYVSAFSPRGLFVDIFSSFGINEISGIDGFIGSWIVLTLFTSYKVQYLISSPAIFALVCASSTNFCEKSTPVTSAPIDAAAVCLL